MNDVELQWIAGVIDAEGSIEMSTQRAKRMSYIVIIRRHRIRISTTDNIIIPKIAKLLNRNFADNNYRKTITINSNQCKKLLIKLLPYLYIKQPQAKLLLKAMSIKDGKNTPYTIKENNQWAYICDKVQKLNMRGKYAPIDNYQRNHTFSWPWLAGLIDGDGTITNSEFGPRNCCTIKPIVKISLTNLKTIEYLSKQLNIKSLPSGGGKGNKRITRAIRLMSNNIYNIIPNILPFLTLKKERALLAFEIVRLRREIPNGQNNHKNIVKVKELINKLDILN